MSTGPGTRQRALLAAVLDAGEGYVLVVPQDATRAEASAWRRAARALALKGKLKAVYVRRLDRSGRWLRHLAVTANDSAVQGDVYPFRSPGWIEVAPPTLTSFNRRIQAILLEYCSGQPCSPAMAGRLAREHLEQSAA